MKIFIILLFLSFFASSSFSQADTIIDFSFDYREHFSGKKGKWSFSGERLFKDSLMYYSSFYESLENDNYVYYFERKWYHFNGELERHIIVNFKKRNRARIIDKSYSQDGNLIEKKDKKVHRDPEETNPEKINWKGKE